MNEAEKETWQTVALLEQAVTYTLAHGYATSEWDPNEERDEMMELLAKLKSRRWILTPVPWEV